MRLKLRWVAGLFVAALMLPGAAPPAPPRPAAAPVVPPFECKAYVGYDRDMELPGYILPTKAGPRTCIPFTSVLFERPKDYQGDFYVAEFTDA
jgi:hypothetical protein